MNISTEEIAGAIGAFGQNGVYHPTRYIKSLKFADNSVKQIRFKSIQAMRKSTAFVMTSILEGVFSSKGTGSASAINGVHMAGKTGTNAYPNGMYTADAMDLWSIGYTKSISTALWYGYDEPMKSGHQLNESIGETQKSKMFKDIMIYMNKGKDVSEWKMPNTVRNLGGSGLNANYQASDSPKKTVTKTLDKVQTVFNNSYPTNKSTKHTKTKKPATPKIPKNYKKGQWQKQLKKEKRTFNEKHKNDVNNAKKVSDDE